MRQQLEDSERINKWCEVMQKKNSITLIYYNCRACKAAGPESLKDYFQKGALLGQKAALHLWYVDTRPNSQKLLRAFKGLSYLAYKIQKK